MLSILQRLVVSRVRRNMSPPLSGLKSKISRNRHEEFDRFRTAGIFYAVYLTEACSLQVSDEHVASTVRVEE
jgi:hypothetical protein